jgi:uncharacterized protein (DUF1778 family)
MRSNNAVLFVRCTPQEAKKIRHAAKLERRTLSGFILNAVLTRIEVREKMHLRAPAKKLPEISS